MSTTLASSVFICARCGIRVPSGSSHDCAASSVVGGGLAFGNCWPMPLPAPALDDHHWLYKAGYEQGRRDAERVRDLSPMGKEGTP